MFWSVPLPDALQSFSMLPAMDVVLKALVPR